MVVVAATVIATDFVVGAVVVVAAIVVAVAEVVVSIVAVVVVNTIVVEAMVGSAEVLGTGVDAMRTWLTDLSGRPAIAPPATTPNPAITANLSHHRGCTVRTVPIHRVLTT